MKRFYVLFFSLILVCGLFAGCKKSEVTDESACAGEVGKGFAVVADEISSLAINMSAENSTEIVTGIKKIFDAMDRKTEVTEQLNDATQKFKSL